MRKLSEIPAEEGIVIMGKLLPVVTSMAQKAGERGELTPIEYLGKCLETSPSDAINMIAIISGVPHETVAKKSVLDILKDVAAITSDDEILSLFG